MGRKGCPGELPSGVCYLLPLTYREMCPDDQSGPLGHEVMGPKPLSIEKKGYTEVQRWPLSPFLTVTHSLCQWAAGQCFEDLSASIVAWVCHPLIPWEPSGKAGALWVSQSWLFQRGEKNGLYKVAPRCE